MTKERLSAGKEEWRCGEAPKRSELRLTSRILADRQQLQEWNSHSSRLPILSYTHIDDMINRHVAKPS
jgi:hypothetical protein